MQNHGIERTQPHHWGTWPPQELFAHEQGARASFSALSDGW